jgi:hypothetical protein
LEIPLSVSPNGSIGFHTSYTWRPPWFTKVVLPSLFMLRV